MADRIVESRTVTGQPVATERPVEERRVRTVPEQGAAGVTGMNNPEPGTNIDETSLLISSDKVEGTNVYRSNGDKLGVIRHLMIDKRSGKVAYAMMSFGGFLGMGDDYRALPWNLLAYNERLGGYELNLSDEQLRGAPPPAQRWDNWASSGVDRGWERNLHDYYRTRPSW